MIFTDSLAQTADVLKALNITTSTNHFIEIFFINPEFLSNVLDYCKDFLFQNRANVEKSV